MEKTIGFIGYGNMAKAMIKGLIEAGLFSKENILVTRKTKEAKEAAEADHDLIFLDENKDLASRADFLVLAIKPNLYGEVLQEIKTSLKSDTIVISIGAGISSEFLKGQLGEGIKYIKTMPNTPALVGEAMTAISLNDSINQEDLDMVCRIFSSFGKTKVIDESLMDGFTGLAGSGPAYIFLLLEAMADGGVLEGLNREDAYLMAAQTVLGSAKMLMETGMHPGQLKDMVCSPGGTSIEALASLEKSGFRSSIIEAIRVCSEKSKDMGK